MTPAAALLLAALLETAPGAVKVLDLGVPAPLTDRPGDARAGAVAFSDRAGAHCLLCHRVDSLDAPFQGTLGPDLSDYGGRMNVARARLRLVDATRLNPDTVMPTYYRTDGLTQVGAAYRGQPVLSAQQIEDILAYLATLISH